MAYPDTSTLQRRLKRTLTSLDRAIAGVHPLDPKLQRALTEMYIRRDDELGRLLAEVAQKAGLLASALVRAEWVARQASSGSEMTSASLITRAVGDQERFTGLDADLPEPVMHDGITIGVNALSASPPRYHLRIHVDYAESFTAGMPGVEGVSALPLLSGVRITDSSGVTYSVKSGGEANTSGDSVRRLTGSLEFTPDPAAKPTTITLHVASVLFADRQAFLATEAAARLVDGPWELTIAVRQPS